MFSIEKENQYKIYPFIHSFSNIKSDENQLAPVLIPDTLATNLPKDVDFSMSAGDFIEVYGTEASKGITAYSLKILMHIW